MTGLLRVLSCIGGIVLVFFGGWPIGLTVLMAIHGHWLGALLSFIYSVFVYLGGYILWRYEVGKDGC